MKLKGDQRLIDLTDKFLTEFIELANEIDKGKPSASFHLNYTFPNVLAQTEAIKLRNEEPGFPFPVMAQNILTELYELGIQNVYDDIMFIINHFDDQLLDDNKFTDLKETKTGYTLMAHSQNVKIKVTIINDEFGFNYLTLEDKSEGIFHKVSRGMLLDSNNLGKTKKLLYFPDKIYLHRIRDINEFYMIVYSVKMDIEEEL